MVAQPHDGDFRHDVPRRSTPTAGGREAVVVQRVLSRTGSSIRVEHGLYFVADFWTASEDGRTSAAKD